MYELNPLECALNEAQAYRNQVDALSAENAKLRDEVERLRQESQSIGMAAYEVGYKDASAHYELEHCPACKNIADLQEALEENAKLRELVRDIDEVADSYLWEFIGRRKEALGIEVYE